MRKLWYAVAYSSDDTISVWSGPFTPRGARLKAEEYETIEHIARARVTRWHAGLTKETEDGLCECGNKKRHPQADGCDECARITAEFRASEARGLRDDVRTLLYRHYPDWIDGAEIRASFNSETSTALSRLIQAGEAESMPVQGMGTMYRLKQRRVA